MINYCLICIGALAPQWRSENPESRISYKHPGARQPLTQDVAVSTAVDEDICCVTPLPRAVTHPAAVENRGMIILWPWNTSRNGEITEKSDQHEIAVR